MTDNLRSFPARTAATAPPPPRSLRPSATEPDPDPTPDTIADMMDLIQHVYDLANWPIPDPASLMSKATEWARLLAPIPRHRLRGAHEAAAAAHQGSYPVNAYEILQGYETVKADLLRYGEIRVELGNPALPAPTGQTSIIGPLRVTLKTLAAAWGEHPTNTALLVAATSIRRAHPGLTLEQFRPLLARAAWGLRTATQKPTLAALVAALESEASGG